MKSKSSAEIEKMAMYIAMVVRNAMEDFHIKHLSNEQMKELNPIIRNAIFTALYASENYNQSAAARKFIDFNLRMIPSYWEQPKLTDEFVEFILEFLGVKIQEP